MATSFLIRTTEEYWLPTRDAVLKFHKELLEDAATQSYNLDSYSYKEHAIKESGEVVDSYFSVKAVKTFDDAKEPVEAPLERIVYEKKKVDAGEEE